MKRITDFNAQFKTDRKLLIFDIDGTLCENLFVRDDLCKETEYFKFCLENQIVFDWITNTDFLDDEKYIITFVTARGQKNEGVTRRWIENSLGIKKYELHLIDYVSREIYLQNKLRKFSEIMNKYKPEKPIFFEDDENIITNIKKIIEESLVIKIFHGEPFIVI